MDTKLIVGNWKANPESPREAKEIFGPVKRALAKLSRVRAVICPPAVFLAELAKLGSERLAVGGQDAFEELSGAYTGQIGPTMLRNAGARYLILGHSERRAAGDTDAIINAKVKLALKNGLRVILCLGEAVRDEAGEYLGVLREQLGAALAGVAKKDLEALIIAYEPVWAIGAQARGADTPAAFREQMIYIRKVFAGVGGRELALRLPILYGGSVTPENAGSFLAEGQADGLLVGRASLRADHFISILRQAHELV